MVNAHTLGLPVLDRAFLFIAGMKHGGYLGHCAMALELFDYSIYPFWPVRRKPMKASKILSIVVIAAFCCAGIAFSDNWKNESGKGRRDKPQYHQQHRDGKQHSDRRDSRDDKRDHDTYRRGDHNSRPDYHSYRGYRERPYGKKRHYEHHDHRGHRYAYQGHWGSWKQWDGYRKAHPDIVKHGDYYREDAHLMFRFRDPVTGGFFFFSIGR
jgi:hypothetical protein